MAQTDNFLKIAPLVGESQDKDHKGWFDLLNFNLNVTQTGSMAFGGGGGTGPGLLGGSLQPAMSAATTKIAATAGAFRLKPEATRQHVARGT